LLLLFNFAFKIAIGRVQVNQDVNILGGSLHTVEKNTEL